MATFDDELWFRRRLFGDGEGVDPTDFNNLQRDRINALLNMFFHGGMQNAMLDDASAPNTVLDLEGMNQYMDLADYAQDMVFTPSPQNGYWFPGGSARTMLLFPGPIAFVSDEPSGPDGVPSGYDSPLTMVYFGGVGATGALSVTTAVGDATNPRIDLIEISIAPVDGASESRDFKDATTGVVTTTTPDKLRMYRITYQVKQGTPAATPEYPSPTAGFTPMCAVYVPATHNAVHSLDNVRDMRVPMGRIRVYDVPAHLMHRYGPTPWTLHSTDFLNTAPSSASFLYAHMPSCSRHERLIAVGIAGSPAGTATANLMRLRYDGGIPTLRDLADLNNLSDPLFDSGAGFGYRTASTIMLMDAIAASGSFHAGTRAANKKCGTPLWCNGSPAGPAMWRTAITDTDGLAVQLSGDASTVSLVRFYTVGGLF